MITTDCCHPSSSNGSKIGKPKVFKKLGAIHMTAKARQQLNDIFIVDDYPFLLTLGFMNLE